ncbi:MAG: hypothetical protein HC769_30030 [Cyanobacteria bacterium CRU_2_1]|nr:hypothetical protein [Cyanobacteria bacterium RU_5_0]NJR62665.1 hypothetical protein [Cyanobacteria bacterium CRU_2_1]
MIRCILTSKSPSSRRVVSALALTGALLLSSSSALPEKTIAAPINLSIAASDKQQSESTSESTSENTLPHQVANRIRRDLARQLDIPRRNLSIASYSQETWSDGCLGIPNPVALCIQATVPGWRVEVTDGNQSWFYRTDATAQVLQLEPQPDSTASELPQEVSDRVLQMASQDSGLPLSSLSIAQAEQRTWNGCFGIDSGDGVCTQIAISGWQVVVMGDQGYWVYHTNNDGSDIRLNEAASYSEGAIVPRFIANSDLPSYFTLRSEAVFQIFVEGGISGSNTELLLLEDGQVVQLVDAAPPVELNRLSPQEVEAFKQLLQEQQFGSLNGLSYPAPSGAADYLTLTLVGRGGMVQAADIVQDQLPPSLQQVIQAWEEIALE